MTIVEIADAASKILLGLGVPAILFFWVKDRRRIRNQANREEQETPFQVRATAASTLDAEVAALQKSFQVREEALLDTIKDQAHTIEELRAEDDRKEAIIEALKRKVRQLQEQYDRLAREASGLKDELGAVSAQLDELQGKRGS